MSAHGDPVQRPRPDAPGLVAKLWNFIVVVLIFVLVGPAAAALSFVALAVAWLSQFGGEEATPLLALATTFGFMVMVSYVVALAPAALAGALFGFWQTFIGRVRWHAAAATGLALGFAAAVMADALVPQGDEKFLLPFFLLTGLAGTRASWLMARSFVTAGERA